ncbi:MAG TPA: cysteine desulfurase family protein [Acidimicrobiales bacterium]|nr:cysteine desulfurase family protein [Acidimicrobiales bacterium]
MPSPVAYLDHAATSPLRPEALAAMLPFLSEHFGNPSGSHAASRRARRAVDEARDTVARHMDRPSGEVVFTSGGTEACNLAVLGAHGAAGGDVLCSAFEHHAVLEACLACGGRLIRVGADGLVDLDALVEGLHPGVRLVSLMAVNNEVGTIQPFEQAVALVRELAPDALVHTDAVAAGAWIDLRLLCAQADLVSLGAHKFGGPKGAGALLVGSGVKLRPVLYGGPQERGRRPGTHDVAAVVGMATALEVAVARRAEEWRTVEALRRRLVDGLLDAVPGVHPTAAGAPRLPCSAHLRFEGVDQEELLVLLDDAGVYASAGSACASGALDPSHVLLAMGFPATEAREAVRFSLGWSTSVDEIDLALSAVPKAIEQLRAG